MTQIVDIQNIILTKSVNFIFVPETGKILKAVRVSVECWFFRREFTLRAQKFSAIDEAEKELKSHTFF